MYGVAYEIIQYYIDNQQYKEKSAGLVIKEQADKKKVKRSEFGSIANKCVAEKHHRKEYPEEHLRENQRRTLIVKKYTLQKLYHFQLF